MPSRAGAHAGMEARRGASVLNGIRTEAPWRLRGYGSAARGRWSDDAQPNVHIAPRGVGIGTYLMGLLHQRLGLSARNARKRDLECDIEAKATGRARADANRRGHGRIGGDFRPALRSHEFH